MMLISRSGLGVSKATVLWLCTSVLWTACKKPPETAVPVQIQTNFDTPSEEEDPVQTDVALNDEATSNDEGVQSVANEVDESGKVEQEKFEFADAVNNAVALLTGDNVAVQQGLEALESLAKSSDSSVPEVSYNIGVAHLKLGNERAAKRSFEEVVELDPTFAKGWYNLGVLLERSRKYDEAIALYEEGLLHSETDPTLSAGKISCLRKSGRLDEAIVYAQQVLSKNANNVDAYSEVGMALLQQGNLDKALFVLQQASAKNGSENAKLQSVFGQVYYAQGKTPLAEGAFIKSLALDPTLIETSMYLSFLQLENRAWTKAKDTLDAALKLEPTNAALLNAMGIAQRGLGNIEEAERLYKEAYQLNPSSPEPLLNLAVLEADYKEGNNYAKSYELLERYLAEGGTEEAIVKQWRSEIEASEFAYLEQKRKEERKALFLRRRAEAARKRAEEEARRAEEEAAQEENSLQNAEEAEAADEQIDGEVEDSSESSAEDAEGNASDGEGSNEETENAENTDDSADIEDVEDADGAEDSTENGTDDVDKTEDDASQTDAEEDTAAVEEAPSQDDNGWGAPVDVDSGQEAVDTEEQINSENSDVEDAEDGDSVEIEGIETQETPPVEDNNGWGVAAPNPTCEVQADCSSDLICASNKECLTPGEFGTLQVGETCENSNECAASLECVEQVCATDSAESDEQ